MPSKSTSLDANNPMREVMAQVISDNPQLRERLTRIIDLMLDDMERTVRYGDPKDRMLLARQIIPGLLRSMQDKQSGAASEQLRAEFERVMAAVRGEYRP
jgi:hypothetical protein